MKENFSFRLQKIIKEKNLTYYKVAKLSNVSKGTISNYINGKTTKPDIMVLCKLCLVLDVAPNWILYGSGIPTLCESDIKYMRYKTKHEISKYELERFRNTMNRIIDEFILKQEQSKAMEEYIKELQER